MKIRYLTEGDREKSAFCAAEAFGGRVTSEDFEEKPYKMLGAFAENGDLAAQFEINENENNFHSSLLKCLEIEGVASRAQYRGQGMVRGLFEYLFNENKGTDIPSNECVGADIPSNEDTVADIPSNECVGADIPSNEDTVADIPSNEDTEADISILYPCSTALYSKFGYVSAGRYLRLEMPFIALKAEKQEGFAKVVTKENACFLVDLYSRLSQNYNLSFVRNDESTFDINPFYTENYTYMWFSPEDNSPHSYASFTIDRGSDRLLVKEIMFSSKPALSGILSFIKNYGANLSTLVFMKLPVNAPIMNFVSDENKAKISVGNIGSVRVLDFRSVLKKINYGGRAEFILKITDDIIKNNSGTFSVKFSGGECEIKKSENEPDFILNQNAMSKIFLTGLTEYESEYIDGFEIINKEKKREFLLVFGKNDAFFISGT